MPVLDLYIYCRAVEDSRNVRRSVDSGTRRGTKQHRKRVQYITDEQERGGEGGGADLDNHDCLSFLKNCSGARHSWGASFVAQHTSAARSVLGPAVLQRIINILGDVLQMTQNNSVHFYVGGTHYSYENFKKQAALLTRTQLVSGQTSEDFAWCVGPSAHLHWAALFHN